jgi:hypothetical protein
MQRGIALLFATVPVLGSLFQIFATLFVLTFCDENCERASTPSGAGLALRMIPAVVVLVTAFVFWLFVAFNNPGWATRAFVVHLVVAVLLLTFWLDHSSHSDDKLLGITAVAEMFAFLALMLCRSEARERQRLLSLRGAVVGFADFAAGEPHEAEPIAVRSLYGSRSGTTHTS